MTKLDLDKNRWIEETRRFQRIAGTEETPISELSSEYDSFTKKRKIQELSSIITHNVIIEQASKKI